MNTPRYIHVLFAFWVALVALSFAIAYATPPNDMGFTKGFNRVAVFFAWQFGALVVAVILALLTGRNRKIGAAGRFLGYAPATLSFVFFAVVIGFVIYANVSPEIGDAPSAGISAAE